MTDRKANQIHIRSHSEKGLISQYVELILSIQVKIFPIKLIETISHHCTISNSLSIVSYSLEWSSVRSRNFILSQNRYQVDSMGR